MQNLIIYKENFFVIILVENHNNIARNINNSIPKTSVLPESYPKNYPDITLSLVFVVLKKSLKLLNH